MARKINPSIAQPSPLLGDVSANAAAKAAPAEEAPKKPPFEYEKVIKEIAETNEAVSRNKELKDSLKTAMIENGRDLVETEFGTAKISKSTSTSVDQEGLIDYLKSNGLSKFVKTKTVEYVDMEEIDSIIYNSGKYSEELQAAVGANTSQTTSEKLLVSIPKADKGAKGSKKKKGE